MQTRSKPGRFPIYALFAAAAFCGPGFAQAADHSAHHMEGTNMTERCQQMMQERQKMMSELKQQDQKLQSLAAQLNQGSEQQKVDRLVQVVQQLVNDRASSHQRMEAMHERMMQHMVQHMQQGGTSMAQCPMMHTMEGMGGSAEDSQQGQEQHQGSGSATK